jgi:hypothetical protein
MRFLIITILRFSIAFASPQVGDILVWNEEKLWAYGVPLESHTEFDKFHAHIKNIFQGYYSTGCGRGYIAKWLISDDKLFLINIFSPHYPNNKIEADLSELFPDYEINKHVFAFWFTGELLINYGEKIHNTTWGYGGYYEKQKVLNFRKSILFDVKEFDNSKSFKSIYANDSDSLWQFIYEKVNWNDLPLEKGEDIKVVVKITSDETTKPNIEIVKRAKNDAYNKEALRAFDKLPAWIRLYDRGEFIELSWIVLMRFNDRNMKKYAR